MNKKLKCYVDGLFADYPNTTKVNELKEEILSNLSEHFNESINNGSSENKAYAEAIFKLGNIDELLQSIEPCKNEKNQDNESFNKEDNIQNDTVEKSENKKIKIICELIPVFALVLYFAISFTTKAWYITWIIFPISSVINKILSNYAWHFFLIFVFLL